MCVGAGGGGGGGWFGGVSGGCGVWGLGFRVLQMFRILVRSSGRLLSSFRLEDLCGYTPPSPAGANHIQLYFPYLEAQVKL